MKNLNIMKKIDLLLLDNIEKLKGSSEFQKITDKYNLLEETHQAVVNTMLMALTFIIPLFIILFAYLFYSSTSHKIELSEKMIETASSIISKSRQLKIESRDLLGTSITSEAMLKNKITSALSSAGIDTSKIIISNFDLFEDAGINEVSADLQFKSLSSQNVYALMQKVFVQSRFRAKTINIEKNTKDQLLEGMIQISHFSKAPELNE
jgi:hypothetical protein